MINLGSVRTKKDKIACLILPLIIMLLIEYDIIDEIHHWFVVRRALHGF